MRSLYYIFFPPPCCHSNTFFLALHCGNTCRLYYCTITQTDSDSSLRFAAFFFHRNLQFVGPFLPQKDLLTVPSPHWSAFISILSPDWLMRPACGYQVWWHWSNLFQSAEDPFPSTKLVFSISVWGLFFCESEHDICIL